MCHRFQPYQSSSGRLGLDRHDPDNRLISWVCQDDLALLYRDVKIHIGISLVNLVDEASLILIPYKQFQ